jgi:hippurate hydrolase
VAVIFQPAEEGGAGAAAMIKDGLMDRFAIDQVYGMHNSPGLAVGKFAIKPGPYMASGDRLNITIEGRGGHASQPNKTIDPVVVGAQLIMALQTIVSRSVDPLEAAVISVCQFHAGSANNIIPNTAKLGGTIRTLRPKVRELIGKRVREVVDGVAAVTGAKIHLDYGHGYPVLVNHDAQTDIAAKVAAEVVGDGNVNANAVPMLGAEDFAYMLEAKPGAFIFIGNGNTAGLHNPAYDFNDEAIVFGTSFWIRLAETQLAA